MEYIVIATFITLFCMAVAYLYLDTKKTREQWDRYTSNWLETQINRYTSTHTHSMFPQTYVSVIIRNSIMEIWMNHDSKHQERILLLSVKVGAAGAEVRIGDLEKAKKAGLSHISPNLTTYQKTTRKKRLEDCSDIISDLLRGRSELVLLTSM